VGLLRRCVCCSVHSHHPVSPVLSCSACACLILHVLHQGVAGGRRTPAFAPHTFCVPGGYTMEAIRRILKAWCPYLRATVEVILHSVLRYHLFIVVFFYTHVLGCTLLSFVGGISDILSRGMMSCYCVLTGIPYVEVPACCYLIYSLRDAFTLLATTPGVSLLYLVILAAYKSGDWVIAACYLQTVLFRMPSTATVTDGPADTVTYGGPTIVTA